MRLTSQVLITSQIENTILELEKLRSSESIVEIISPSIASNMATGQEDEPRAYKVHRISTEKEIFSVTDAKLAIEKAYMASEETTIIILAAKSFSPIVQNKLLKVIEEPPKNKEFIIISPSKSTILATIKSRLPIIVLSEEKEEDGGPKVIGKIDLDSMNQKTRPKKKTVVKVVEKPKSKPKAKPKKK